VTDRFFKRWAFLAMRPLAFASAFASPRPTTPWLLLREERCDTDPSPTLVSLRTLVYGALIPFAPHQIVTTQFEDLFIPLSGNFSAFTRVTHSLSVWLYLVLEVDTPVFVSRIRGTLLAWFQTLKGSHTRLSLSLACRSRHLCSPSWFFHPTSPPGYPGRIRCALFGVQSPLLAKSRYWFLFLPLLECFNSRRIRPLQGTVRPWDHGLLAPTPSLSRLAAVLRFYQSRAIH
jgi:hypothetical protein